MNNKLILRECGKDPLYKTWHTTNRALFMFVHSGSGSLVTKDRSYPLQDDVLILIKPATYHYTMPDEPEHYVRSKLILSSANYHSLTELLDNNQQYQELLRRPVVYAKIPADARADILKIFAEAETCQNGSHDAPYLMSCVLRLLYFLNQYGTDKTAVSADFMSQAIQYINENISLDLDLDGICAAIGISKYYFCRQFKLQLGMTVMRYILNTRIMLAKEELDKSEGTISQISEKCGFSSASYFCQVFKTETGLTPLQYRKHSH